VVVIGLAIVGAGLVGLGLSAGLTANPQTPEPSRAVAVSPASTKTPTPAPTLKPTASPTVEPQPSPTPGYGTSVHQAALMQFMSPGLRPTCERAELVGRSVADVECSAEGVDDVYYDLYLSSTDLVLDWGSIISLFAVSSNTGDCAAGENAEHSWAINGVTRGRYLCSTSQGPMLVWTDWTTLTRGWIFGDSVSALLARWSEHRDLDARQIGTADAVEGLLRRIAPDIASTCEARVVSAGQLASLSCSMSGVSSVTFVSFSSTKALKADWARVIKRMRVTANSGILSCDKGRPGEGSWHHKSSPNTMAGRMACARMHGSPSIAWTDSANRVRMTIAAPTFAVVYARWLNGYFLVE
jgi:hypothetical protein